MATKKPRAKRSDERKLDGVYFASLNRLVDKLFEIAAKRLWTWEKLANESGLSASTIHNLGDRTTKYPQFRTVELLARSLGGKLDYRVGTVKQPAGRVTLKIWDLSSKTMAKKQKPKLRVHAA